VTTLTLFYLHIFINSLSEWPLHLMSTFHAIYFSCFILHYDKTTWITRFPALTFLSGNLLALLNKINSSNRKTWRRHFFPFPCQTRNSFCRSSLPCSLTFTCSNTNWLQNTYEQNLQQKLMRKLCMKLDQSLSKFWQENLTILIFSRFSKTAIPLIHSYIMTLSG